MAEDTIECYIELAKILDIYGFGWVVAQAEAEIAEGRAITKDVSAPVQRTQADTDTFEIQTPRHRRAKLVTTEPFDNEERLNILLQGVEVAIGRRADLELEIMETLDLNFVEFIPEEEDFDSVTVGTRPKRHKIDSERTDAGVEVRRTLDLALQSLRKDTNVNL